MPDYKLRDTALPFALRRGAFFILHECVCVCVFFPSECHAGVVLNYFRFVALGEAEGTTGLLVFIGCHRPQYFHAWKRKCSVHYEHAQATQLPKVARCATRPERFSIPRSCERKQLFRSV